jgi:hypothetical protein
MYLPYLHPVSHLHLTHDSPLGFSTIESVCSGQGIERPGMRCHSKSENLRPRGRKDDQHLWPVTNAGGNISSAMVLCLSAHAVLPLQPPVPICLLDEASPVDRNSIRMAPLARRSIALVHHPRPLQRHRRLFVKHTGIRVLRPEQIHPSTRQAQLKLMRIPCFPLQRGHIS